MNNEKKRCYRQLARDCAIFVMTLSASGDSLRRNSNSQITPISLRTATPMRNSSASISGQFSSKYHRTIADGLEVDDRGAEETNELDKST